MKRVIRKGVFETNSSTSHSCVIMPKSVDEEWEAGGKYLYHNSYWNNFKDLPEEDQPIKGCLYIKEEIINFYKGIGVTYNEDEWEEYEEEDRFDYFLRDNDSDFISYDTWCNSDWEEYDSEIYTTPGGETIVVHCKYGRDG